MKMLNKYFVTALLVLQALAIAQDNVGLSLLNVVRDANKNCRYSDLINKIEQMRANNKQEDLLISDMLIMFYLKAGEQEKAQSIISSMNEIHAEVNNFENRKHLWNLLSNFYINHNYILIARSNRESYYGPSYDEILILSAIILGEIELLQSECGNSNRRMQYYCTLAKIMLNNTKDEIPSSESAISEIINNLYQNKISFEEAKAEIRECFVGLPAYCLTLERAIDSVKQGIQVKGR